MTAESREEFTARCAGALHAFGHRFDGDVLGFTRELYRPHLDLTPAPAEIADVAYGDDPRHRLDVYKPQGPAKGVVVFVHGGGFVAGDKNAGGVYYRNIGLWLAREGWAAVLPTYRLAPGAPWPAGARDLARAMTWVSSNRNELAPAGTPLVLWGQSAGASHVATWLFDDEARGAPRAEVSAVMLMSGFYQAAAPLPAGPLAYFGDDPSAYEKRSPLSHVKRVDMPLWVGLAQLDPAWIAHHSYALAHAITLAQGHSPDFHFLRGHNHVSTVQSLGSPQTDAADEILRFLGSVR